MRRFEANMNDMGRCAFGQIGLGQTSGDRVRFDSRPQNEAVRGRAAIGALILAMATATACGTGRGDSAISGPLSTPIATPFASAHLSVPIAGRSLDGPVFHDHDARRKGVIRADLMSAAAVFRATAYDTLIVHVQSASAPNVVSRVKSELAASRQVVLDSDGDAEGRILVEAIARATTGGGPKTEGALMFMVQEGVYAVTPLESVATHQRRQTSAGKPLSAGNTARYALGID